MMRSDLARYCWCGLSGEGPDPGLPAEDDEDFFEPFVVDVVAAGSSLDVVGAVAEVSLPAPVSDEVLDVDPVVVSSLPGVVDLGRLLLMFEPVVELGLLDGEA